MGSFSIWHWMIVLVIVLVLFGRGRVSEIMGDFGKGIKSFKQGMNEEENKASSTPAPQITAQQGDAPVVTPAKAENKTEQS
ncbi:MAG: sec-independent protein translocase protein TatA [Novosphingobium lindaniclasticum]|jgi:sec-independent protein translocase protein TatA|uniref:Sec-independent protein translocase protein TatA n=1 Tax=Novosphingobium lindaniclasticum LE124 TaxID=1096930 RepID=T0HHL2_9SPHN|nr:twin-arginine translocase TatA/TatE family subunit [Novosphingobium lindaniclasticum]EQB15796.1 preprotein translocase subunit TatA [Novosphingobium lindaniclasticum LE124]MDF2639284.1 sec-independent protein translocase protein TatA [Novosphingobium lindaniclasticum]